MSRLLPPSLSACLLVLALAVAGCGSDADPAPTTAPAPASSAAAAVSSSSAPTADPGATSVPTPSPSSSPPGGAEVTPLAPTGTGAGTSARKPMAAHLLAGDRLPALAAGAVWTESGTGPEDFAVVGACQKTDLMSIGAMTAVLRTSTDSGGASATQVVGTFVDRLSATQAVAVLAAWHDDCATRVPGAQVTPLQQVRVRTGAADHYRVTTADRVSGFGILRKGTVVTVVEVAGPPASTPAGWSPAKVALRRIARTFA